MRILVLSLGAAGHVNPVLGILERLVADGHTVGWNLGPRDEGEVTVPKGVERIRHEPRRTMPERPPGVRGSSTDGVIAREGHRFWASTVVPTALPRTLESAKAFAPDVMAVDGFLWHGLIAAHQLGVPYAAIGTGLHYLAPENFRFPTDVPELPSLKTEFKKLFASHGMGCEVREMYVFSPHLNIVFTTEAFVGADVTRPPNTHLVGPVVAVAARSDEASDFPWSRLRADDRIVFASLGTNFGADAAMFVRLAAACAKLDVQLILKVNDLLGASFLSELPGDVIPVKFAPQLALLERVACFVTHGGANSVMEAMYFGCPVLVVPYGIDQGLNAYFIEHAGDRAPGLAVTPHATTEALERALVQLIDRNGSARRNARRVKESYRAHDGTKRASELIASLGKRAS